MSNVAGDASLWALLGQIGLGLPIALGAIGSAIGISAAGRAAAGAWAKEAKAGQPLNFKYIIFAGMPLSQTIYAFIFTMGLAGIINGDNGAEMLATHGGTFFALGLACGLAELFSAWMQGLVGAAGCRTLSDGGGNAFVNIIIAMGIVETVGLFGFVFLQMVLPAAG